MPRFLGAGGGGLRVSCAWRWQGPEAAIAIRYVAAGMSYVPAHKQLCLQPVARARAAERHSKRLAEWHAYAPCCCNSALASVQGCNHVHTQHVHKVLDGACKAVRVPAVAVLLVDGYW